MRVIWQQWNHSRHPFIIQFFVFSIHIAYISEFRHYSDYRRQNSLSLSFILFSCFMLALCNCLWTRASWHAPDTFSNFEPPHNFLSLLSHFPLIRTNPTPLRYKKRYYSYCTTATTNELASSQVSQLRKKYLIFFSPSVQFAFALGCVETYGKFVSSRPWKFTQFWYL